MTAASIAAGLLLWEAHLQTGGLHRGRSPRPFDPHAVQSAGTASHVDLAKLVSALAGSSDSGTQEVYRAIAQDRLRLYPAKEAAWRQSLLHLVKSPSQRLLFSPVTSKQIATGLAPDPVIQLEFEHPTGGGRVNLLVDPAAPGAAAQLVNEGTAALGHLATLEFRGYRLVYDSSWHENQALPRAQRAAKARAAAQEVLPANWQDFSPLQQLVTGHAGPAPSREQDAVEP